MKQTKTNISWAFLALLLGLLWMPNAVRAQVEDGTAENPFLIENEQELWDFHDCMVPGSTFYFYEGSYTMSKPTGTDGVDYITIPSGCKGMYVKLTTDIVINKGNVAGCNGIKDSTWKAWTPMEIFNGHFDGGYHVVSGLFCTDRDSSLNKIHERGFFTQISDSSSVSRLGVVNSYISGAKAVGGITGYLINHSTVEECFFEGTLESYDVNTGGIVGISEMTTDIRNCYSSGRIYATRHYVGGIIGNCHTFTNVTNCYSNMMIMSDGSLTGAIYGYNNGMGNVTNCYYDKQLSTLNTDFNVPGLLTRTMTNASWQVLGDRFETTENYYPHIKGFSMGSPMVVMSVTPIFLNATDDDNYEKVDELANDFDLGGASSGVVWSATSWNDAITVEDESYHATVNKEGVVDLIARMDTLQRTYIIIPHKAPFLGSEENPFIIDNLTDLTNFRNGINGGLDFIYRRFNIAYTNLPNIHWLQTSDIDMASVANWIPIGNAEKPFKGYYNGGDKKITKLYCSTKNVYSGLFGYASDANFSNLILYKDTFTNATLDLGALCGYIKNSHVTNCIVQNCYVESNANNTTYGTGGICGRAENITIDHCTNDYSNVYGYYHSGGIIGIAKSSQINYCHNNAYITHKGKTDTYRVGGILSSATSCNLTFCSNRGDVLAYDGPGGIIGRSEGTSNVKYCFNVGKISSFTKASSAGGGGIVGYNNSTCKVYYSFNTGTVIANYDSPEGTGGIGGTGVNVYHCINVGKVVGGNSGNTYSGLTKGTSSYSYNTGRVEGEYNIYPISNGSSTACLFDNNMCVDQISQISQGRSTSQLIGTASVFRSLISNAEQNNWIFAEGMYPRLAWTDSLDWARDIAIAAATPILLTSEDQNVDKVKPGMKLLGCDSNVVWQQMPQEEGVQGGCLFVDLAQDIADNECEDNAIIPHLNAVCIGPTTVGAYTNGQLVKTVELRRYVEPTKDTLTIDNFADLDTLRKGVNSNEAFYYKEHLLPRYADSIYFRITADIAMSSTNWVSIGGKDLSCHFGGNILGDGHTISNLKSNGTYAGLFGRCSGSFKDIHFTGVSITGGTYQGALCAEMIGGAKAENCTVKGTLSGSGTNTGGLVGSCSGSNYIKNCINYATVSTTSTGTNAACGGLVGTGNANTLAINCRNAGTVTAAYCVGGIIGKSGVAQICYNTGEVIGKGTCVYIGGIGGNGTVIKQCYNVATITAEPGNSTSNHYVGGIVGSGNPENCYNAGIIYGNNRKYVGGICGSGNPKNCYNSNTARSDGTYLGGVTASGSPANCYYDNQLNIPNTEIAGAVGKSTEEMLTNGIQMIADTTPYLWTFSELLYPQLSAFAGTAPSVSSVMPVALSNGETWKNVSHSFYMHGCSEGDWNLMQGNCVALDTTSGHCQTNVLSGFGVVQLGASVNDTVYRKVRILVNISEENPIVIKSYTELKNFAKVINSSVGYYNSTAQTFHTTMEEAGANMVEIKDGGLDLFFKLIVDIDVPASDPVWTPIGDYKSNTAYRFRGDFNADHHTIKGMKFGAGNYQGLFGYTDGAEIYDLTMDSCSMTGNGTYKGMLCGLNNGTDITNCKVMHSTVSGASIQTGMLVGRNQYAVIENCNGTNNTMSATDANQGDICGYDYWGTIKHCTSSHFTLFGNGSYAGGISGRSDYSTTDSCLVEDLQATGKSTGYVGGIGGSNVRGTVSHCEVRNSKIDVTGPHVGGIVGENFTSSSYSGNVNPVVQYCSTENVTVKSSGNNVGGIIGRHYGSSSGATCQYCTTNGGTVTGTGSYTGGIVGYAYDGTNKILKCTNNNSVSGVADVGGVSGYIYSTTIDTCVNNASVTATGSYAGGIVGYSSYTNYVKNSYNIGDVKGTSYVGGIEGYQYNSNSAYVTTCFNEGRVTGSGNYVGGIVGQLVHGKITHSYNTGIVKGNTYVGGVMGNITSTNQTSSLNYNIGWVEGGGYIGAICGNGGESYLSNNFYDKQMVPCKGISSGIVNKDVAGTIAKTTNEMLNEELSAKLGTANWTYTPGMYPRLKVWDTTNAAITSVQPVLFPCTESDTVYAQDVPVGDYNLSGCENGTSWVRTAGNGITVNNNCTFTVDGRNYVEIANVRQGDTMKVVKMSLGISEENPLDIVSLEQFKKFRDLINTAQTFYYDDVTKGFYAEGNEDYVKIDPCGDNMFFRLITDIDLTLETGDWTPIGNRTAGEAVSFKGHFNGADHTVKGVKFTSNNSYMGLFGLSYGTIKNLTVVNPQISGAGQYVAAVVGYNRGIIDNCACEGGYVKGKNQVGGVVGYSLSSPIDHCHNSAQVTGEQNVGGVIGQLSGGSMNRSFNMGIVTATGGSSYVGGVVGQTNAGIYYCYNVGAVNGKNYMGGVVGYSQTEYVNWCYNAGLVNSTNGSKTYVGAVLSTNDTKYFPTACYYDKQMSDVPAGIGYNGQIDNVGKTTGFFTEEMIGEESGTKSGLGTTEWVYEEGKYPYLKSREDLDASVASVQPVYITEHLKCRELSLPFTVSTLDDVAWSRRGSSYALDLENISEGKVGVSICGEDTLQVKKNNVVKLVPLYVEKMAAAAVVDTACDGYYRWAANGRYYTQSDSITIALTVTEGCDSLMSLYLTIPPVMTIKMKSENYTCYESTNAYAEATVTGGFEQGYLYSWINEDGVEVSTTNRIDLATCGELFGPGTYHLSVRDAVHQSCEKTTEVTITRPDSLQIAVDFSDGMCYNQNDGYVAIDVKGGTMPYVVSWGGGSMDVSEAKKDTITGLAARTYTITATDANGCVVDTAGVDLTEDATEYAVTAFAVNKMYDGIGENPARYILKIGTGAADTLASDSCKVLANGDTLRAHVSLTDSVKDVVSLSNLITCTITSEEGEDVTCRYNVTTHNSNVIISKRDVILTSASAQKEYDGSPLTAPTVTVSGSGFVGEEGVESYNVTGTQTEAGASLNTFEYTLNANTNPDNYQISKVEGTLVVGPKGFLTVVANSNAKVYDGTPLTDPGYTYIFPIDVIGANDTVIAVVSGTITDVGTQVNTLDSSSIRVLDKTTSADHTANYKYAPVVHGTLTITQRNVTVTTAEGSKVYDGIALTNANVTISGDGFVEGELASCTATGTITNVGETDNNVEIVTTGAFKQANYDIDTVLGKLTVTQRSLNIIGDSRSIAYDGQPHTLNAYTAPNLVSGHVISGISYLAEGKDKGSYLGAFTGTESVVIKDASDNVVTGNYDISFTPGTLTIGQSVLPLVVKSNTNSFMYDGQLHKYQDYTVLYNSTAVPYTSPLHYMLPTGDELVITPKDKGALGVTHVTESCPNNFSITLTNQSFYSSITLDTGRINITPRLVELRSNGEWSLYTGMAIPTVKHDTCVQRSGYGFPVGEGVTCTITGSQVEVGSSPNTFTYTYNSGTQESDYDISIHNGTLTVAKAPLKIVAVDTNKYYGEENPKFVYRFEGFVNGEDTLHNAPFLPTSTRPVLTTTAELNSPSGQYPINVDVTGVEFQNYVVEPQDGILTIRRRPLKIQALSVTVTYDGVQHTWVESAAPHYEILPVEHGGLLAKDSVKSIIIAGSRTLGGVSQIEPSGVLVNHYGVGSHGQDSTWDITSCYEPEYINGKLTITPVEITLQPIGYEHDFDGHTYNSSYTDAPHYVLTGTLVPNDTILGMVINGSRSAYGKTPFVIDSATIQIVNKVEEPNYEEPTHFRNAGYHITLLTDTLSINHRSTPYEITMQGKSDSLVYNGQLQSYSGWDTTKFEFDGFIYEVVDVTSKMTNKDTVNTYTTVISGTARVLGEGGEDVSAEFNVTTNPGTVKITPKPLKLTAYGVDVEYDFLEHSYKDNLHPYCWAEGLCAGHTITKIALTGERTAVGREDIRIITDSIVIENSQKNAVTKNYKISTIDSAIHIRDRVNKDTFRLVSKSQTLVYDGASHTLTGFDTLRFMVRANDAQHTPVYFTIDGVAATTISSTSVGEYVNAITGTPVVKDASLADVSGSFVVLADTGKMTITKRSITFTARDTTFYTDGYPHSSADMHDPKYTISGAGLAAGHTAEVTVTSESISSLGSTPINITNVVIKDAGSNVVTDNYDVSTVPGTLKIEGYLEAITISSASAEFEVDGTRHRKEVYAVTFGGDTVSADGTGKIFTLSTGDKLTITPTATGVRVLTDNAEHNNTFIYTLEHNTQYIGTRDTTFGTLKIYDSLHVVTTSIEPVTCNGYTDGKATFTITGGKTNLGKYKYKLDTEEEVETTSPVSLTGLAYGDHSFLLTDSLGYTRTVNFTIDQPESLTLSLTGDNEVCSDGTIMATTTGGNEGVKTFELTGSSETWSNNNGLFNGLPNDTYTVTVTDVKNCQVSDNFTLEGSTYTMPYGLTKMGSLTQYAKDTTVDRKGNLTRFPSLLPTGQHIEQPSLSAVSATQVSGGLNVSVQVISPTFAPVLEFQVSTNSDFENAYTYKVVQVTEGTKTHKFELPAGDYYVRAKLYNCNDLDGVISTRSGSIRVN
ncbi:MAG: hypothetical protein MJZ58_01130 [Paludibacteraceae bacterium]|nr:hypothetical protein [Paludibacteraceae bacterium]